MGKFKLIKETDKSTALNKAQKISGDKKMILHVIEAREIEETEAKTVFFIDDNGFIRTSEKLIASFENGTKI